MLGKECSVFPLRSGIMVMGNGVIMRSNLLLTIVHSRQSTCARGSVNLTNEIGIGHCEWCESCSWVVLVIHRLRPPIYNELNYLQDPTLPGTCGQDKPMKCKTHGEGRGGKALIPHADTSLPENASEITCHENLKPMILSTICELTHQLPPLKRP